MELGDRQRTTFVSGRSLKLLIKDPRGEVSIKIRVDLGDPSSSN